MNLGQVGEYFGVMVAGVPLLFVVMGLVQWIKSLGVEGNASRYASMVIGVVFGVGYMVFKAPPPAGETWPIYAYWFANVVYGIGLGVVASGLYDTVKNLLKPIADAISLLKSK